MFKVFRTQEFETQMHKLFGKSQVDRVEKIEDEISEKGFVGKPLGFKFLREKRISKKRVYFIIYEAGITMLVCLLQPHQLFPPALFLFLELKLDNSKKIIISNLERFTSYMACRYCVNYS